MQISANKHYSRSLKFIFYIIFRYQKHPFDFFQLLKKQKNILSSQAVQKQAAGPICPFWPTPNLDDHPGYYLQKCVLRTSTSTKSFSRIESQITLCKAICYIS